MSKNWKTLVVALFLAAMLPDSAQAQEVPAVEIVGGYNALAHRADLDSTFPRGWFAGAGWNVTDQLAIVGEISGNRETELTFSNIRPDDELFSLSTQVYTLFAGPRYSHRFARMTPFVQFLAGAAYLERDARFFPVPLPMPLADFLQRSPVSLDPVLRAPGHSLTKAAVQVGGGVDIPLTQRFSVRLAGDYRQILGVAMNQVRFAAGVSVGIGRR